MVLFDRKRSLASMASEVRGLLLSFGGCGGGGITHVFSHKDYPANLKGEWINHKCWEI